ncbi:MAG: lysylphosphatidylglycerol synthase domain-containing protein [Vicinamibacterales bacterium]
MLRIGLLLGGIALLVLLFWSLGPSKILDELRKVGWYIAPVIVLGAAHQLTRAFALRACVLRPGVVRYRDVLAIHLSGEAIQSLTFTGPVLAESMKAWLLESRGLTLKEGFACTLTEYLIYAFVSAAMSIAGLLYLVSRFDPSPTLSTVALTVVMLCTAFLVASAVAIARRFYLIGTVVAGLGRVRILRGGLTPNMSWINGMEDLLLATLRDSPVRLAGIAILEVAAHALVVVESFVILRALGVMTTGWLVFVIEASVKFFEFAFLFIPLRLGASEGAYAAVLGVMGLPVTAGFAVAFLRRARGLTVASVGLALLPLMTRSSSTISGDSASRSEGQ